MKPVPLAHPGIRDLQPYVPGKPAEEVARELGLDRVVKLASNENPLGPSPRAVARMQAVLADAHRYPDGACVELRGKLAERTGLDPDWILCGNGSNELLELALRTFVQPGEAIATAAVTFSVYEILARAAGALTFTAPMTADLAYDLEHLAQVVKSEKPRLVFVANPNNPTGTAFDRAAFERFVAAVPESTIVVYDAAYAEYGIPRGIPDGIDLVKRYPNVIATRSFSKAHGLAGVRIGWGVGNPELIDFMDRVRQPFNVNRIAQAAALGALEDEAFVERVVNLNERSLVQLAEALAAMGLQTYPSYANFVLCRVPISADEVFERLLHRGVIVRSMRGFGLPDHIRVNTGTEEENDVFLEALAAVLRETGHA